MSNFNLTVPKCKSSGEHTCMSYTFSIAILDGICFFALRKPRLVLEAECCYTKSPKAKISIDVLLLIDVYQLASL